ncbi:MAG: hypothetical protein V2G42_02395 [bacterium JZ-2024 1]
MNDAYHGSQTPIGSNGWDHCGNHLARCELLAQQEHPIGQADQEAH